MFVRLLSRLAQRWPVDEGHPTTRWLKVAGGGFAAGLGFFLALLQLGLLPGIMTGPPKIINCEILGVETINRSFHERVSGLQEELRNIQKKLSDPRILNSTQQRYEEAIQLLNEEIAQERALLKDSLLNLERKCRE